MEPVPWPELVDCHLSTAVTTVDTVRTATVTGSASPTSSSSSLSKKPPLPLPKNSEISASDTLGLTLIKFKTLTLLSYLCINSGHTRDNNHLLIFVMEDISCAILLGKEVWYNIVLSFFDLSWKSCWFDVQSLLSIFGGVLCLNQPYEEICHVK